MKARSSFILLAIMLAGGAPAWSQIVLPDACGKDDVKFEAHPVSALIPTPAPADGKAHIVFIQSTVLQGGSSVFGRSNFTTRLGIDGVWVGAAASNTFFEVDVAPGERHLCVSVQGIGSAAERMVAADSFTAEGDKFYYFMYSTERLTGGNANYYSSKLERINADEGKYKEKLLPRSDFVAKK
jgi:hypothetical protein